MSSVLFIFTPNGATLLHTVNNTAAGGIDGGYRWQLAPNGDCIQLEFSGRNDRLRIPPRGVVALIVDSVPAFYGVIPDPPPATDPESRTIQALGGREALRVTLMDGAVYTDQGVYAIVRDILDRLIPPVLNYGSILIGDGSGTDAGPTLSTFYAPTTNLHDVLDGLAKSAGVTWGVNTSGQVFFAQPPPPALAIDYAGHGWRFLPVQGREAVTQAVLRIVTASALPDGAAAQWSSGVPGTVATVAEAAEHSLYRAARAFPAPEGMALLTPSVPTGAGIGSDYPPDAVRDDDPATGVDIPLGDMTKFLEVLSASGRVVGVEFDYLLPPADDRPEGAYAWALDLNAAGGQAGGALIATNAPRTVRVILPPAAFALDTWNARFVIGGQIAIVPAPTGPALTVSRVRFLLVDEVTAAQVAASYLQPPYATPGEITLKTIVPPTPDVTVTGAPGGDVSGPTTLWEYQHDLESAHTTKIRIGATGADPTVRALKFALGQP